MKNRRSAATALFTLALTGIFFLTDPVFSQPFGIDFSSKPIRYFKVGDTATKFGKLEFIGGIEFSSSNQHVGALSGLAMFKDRTGFVAVTDTGFWFTANIERDGDGRPVSLSNGRMAPILDETGNPYQYKWNSDAESIYVTGNEALISFERDNRVASYRLDLENFASLPLPVELNIGADTLRGNKGLETVIKAPTSSPLQGGIIVISENTKDARGNIRAAITSGPLKGLFSVKRKGKFNITDGDFLPNGDMILLERRYNLAKGIGMRIRRIKAARIKPGAVLKGKKLIKANGEYQVDNMEGLSVTTDDKGNTYISLISDDNHSMLQRNLYLEFKLVDEN